MFFESGLAEVRLRAKSGVAEVRLGAEGSRAEVSSLESSITEDRHRLLKKGGRDEGCGRVESGRVEVHHSERGRVHFRAELGQVKVHIRFELGTAEVRIQLENGRTKGRTPELDRYEVRILESGKSEVRISVHIRLRAELGTAEARARPEVGMTEIRICAESGRAEVHTRAENGMLEVHSRAELKVGELQFIREPYAA